MSDTSTKARGTHVLDTFRRWGHLAARIDPLNRLAPERVDELEGEGPEFEAGRRAYCGALGIEFMHIPDPARRDWIARKMEAEAPGYPRPRVLEALIRADCFEETLQKRYIGTKRYSLEGNTALIPFLHEVLEQLPACGAAKVVLGMSHRGRLNVLANVMAFSLARLFADFEDVDPRKMLGGGDLRYHLGATGRYTISDGRAVSIHLVSNPSHLEAVVPVALGRARALQMRSGKGKEGVVPLVVHGDAAFAGQGILAEALNMATLDGYDVGGTIHVVVNNLIGFTTDFQRLHSSRYATDVAKRLPIPILHVNGEDMDAVIRAARICAEYRCRFSSDVVVDLIGYRRHGHSEVDDPTVTQPRLYARIAEHPRLWKLFADEIGVGEASCETSATSFKGELDRAQEEGAKATTRTAFYVLPDHWKPYIGGLYRAEYEVDTGVTRRRLRSLSERLISVPDGFHVHPKVAKLLEKRAAMGRGEEGVDYGMAEALAFASLVEEGVPVRLSGEDTRRGTFNHRHSVLVDVETEEEHVPLQHIGPDQGRFEVYDTQLSEAAVLGFEYGVSRDAPESLVLWEAQFGDFANGAQVVIDQFICAGEDKWGLLSGVVLLLPHGFEGQGPEHSSARLERFLQVAAEGGFQVCQPTTAAQYFHLLRRQALRKWRVPLAVMTPKGYLRHPAAASPLEDFTVPRFQTVLGDGDVESATRVVLCTGKIAHELRKERSSRKEQGTAIATLEQLYPFPEDELEAELARHPDAREILWVQEEPANMGALSYVLPLIGRLARGRRIRTVKRSASSSPATGSPKAHALEQKTILTLALSKPESSS